MKKVLVCLVLVALGLLAASMTTVLADETPPSSPNDGWIEFTTWDPPGIPDPNPPYTHTQDFDVPFDAWVSVWIWDTGSDPSVQDDVVDIYIDDVYIGTADSRGDPAGGTPKLIATINLEAGTHEFKMIIVYSEQGGSVWAKKFDIEPKAVPEFALSLPLVMSLVAAAYFLIKK